MSDLTIGIDDPRDEDVRAVLETHLSFARSVTPLCDVHALDVEDLLDPAVTLFSARRDGRVLAVAALRQLDSSHAEVKSMHTTASARGQGVGRAMVEHLLAVAGERGYRRVSLETGAMEEFAPARALYASVGFAPCPPFAEYTDSPNSQCMSIQLGEDPDSQS